MSLDLYQNESVDRLSRLQPVQSPEAGTFDSFFKGTASYTMRSLATVARTVDMAGAALPVVYDKLVGGTVAQDQYFKQHDDYLNSAVDYWTPRTNEVGVAGQVTGELIGTLAVALGMPGVAVSNAQLGTAEELTRQGVDSGKAMAVGAVQGAGMGAGIWMPILGKTGWQRVIVGGAGFNAAQGIATRGLSGVILDGTPAADQFNGFDATQVTLDVLLGAAFGTMAHLSPAQRAQGAKAWDAIGEWGQRLRPADRDALATLRVAQHLNVDSAPGILDTHEAIDAHTTRMRTALDQVLREEPVELSNLPYPRTSPDEVRISDMLNRTEALRTEGDVVARTLELDDGNSEIFFHGTSRNFDQFDNDALRSQKGFPDRRGHYFTKYAEDAKGYAGENGRVIEAILDLKNPKIVDEPPSYLTKSSIKELENQGYDGLIFRDGEEVVVFDSKKIRQIQKKEQPPAPAGARTEAQPAKAAPPLPPPGADQPAGASAKPDLLAMEAQRMAAEQPDAQITIGRNPDGSSITTSTAKYLADMQSEVAAAREQASLFEVAAGCYLARA